jgi:hypothetical protein
MEDSSPILLNEIANRHLNNYPYSSVLLFSQGLLQPEERRTPNVNLYPPLYCLQQNELLFRELVSAGYSADNIQRMPALVVNRFDGECDNNTLKDTPIAHDVLFYNNSYFLDVGYGSNSLRGALAFRGLEEEVSLAGELYRFKHISGFTHYTIDKPVEWWGVFLYIDSKWLELWRFPRNNPLDLIGLEELNSSLVHSSNMIFIRDKCYLVAKVTPTLRVAIRAFKNDENNPIPVLKTVSLVIDDNNEIPSVGISVTTCVELLTWDDFVQAHMEHFNLSPPPEDFKRCFYVR